MKPPVYDIIDMDVLRSFTCFDQPNKEGLKKVLKTTAYDIQDGKYYCQGMNYIAGYFLILMKQNQEQAFYLFRQFISQYMIDIYDDSFRKLQGYFYVLDSVIKNYLPNVSKNFKVDLTEATQDSVGVLRVRLVHHDFLELSPVHKIFSVAGEDLRLVFELRSPGIVQNGDRDFPVL